MGQGQPKQGAPPGGHSASGASGRGGNFFGNVLRSGPTPYSDALVQQEAGSERHILSQQRVPDHPAGGMQAAGGRSQADAGTTDHISSDRNVRGPGEGGGSHGNMSAFTSQHPGGSRSDGTLPSVGGATTTAGGGGANVSPVPANIPPTGSAEVLPVAPGTQAAVVEHGEQLFPVMIRLGTNNQRHEGIQLLLEHRNWEPIPMSPSGTDSFFALVSLPRGPQKYRFKVDGWDHVDPASPQVSAVGDTAPANVIDVKESAMSTKEDDDPVDDPNGWGQERIHFEETKKAPPILPPHLRYTPLNTPFTQYRQDAQGGFNIQEQRLDPENIPLPLSVTINHVYFQRREDHTVLGVTTRYRSKFSTVVYYKGTSSVEEAEC